MKKYKPTGSGIRGTVINSFKKFLTTSTPNKKLTSGFKRHKGRNSQGKITMRHRGGGAKRNYRKIDFLYDKVDIPAKVEQVEYDPNRTGFIALLCYKDGERRYILAPHNIKVGGEIITSPKASPRVIGNRLHLRNIPVGTFVYNVEMKKHGSAKIARSAGSHVELIGYDEKHAILKMPSSEIRKVPIDSYASIGNVSNEENHLRVEGKAGRNRHKGRRPIVRGSAMNAADHPHGGGEGRAGRGRRRAVTKWGKPSGKRQKTRKPTKYSNQFIVKRRKVGKKR